MPKLGSTRPYAPKYLPRSHASLWKLGCASALLIYGVGCVVLAGRVRDACTHGNCRHGFYSKYTYGERTDYSLWQYGFPTIVLVVVYALASRFQLAPNRRNQAASSSGVAQQGAEPRAPAGTGVRVRQPYTTEPGHARSGTGTLRCRSCGAPMVLRLARRGRSAGSQFWGCSRFPECRGTLPYMPTGGGNTPKSP
jgi:hypothetical protein